MNTVSYTHLDVYKRQIDDHIGEGAPLERFQRNLDAIRTLKTVETENRNATAEEMCISDRLSAVQFSRRNNVSRSTCL